MYSVTLQLLVSTNNNVDTIPLTKTTAAQNEVAISYHRVRGLYFLAVVFVATIIILKSDGVYSLM